MINNSILIRINANGNNDKFQNIAALGIQVLFRDDLDLNSNFQENIRIVPFDWDHCCHVPEFHEPFAV